VSHRVDTCLAAVLNTAPITLWLELVQVSALHKPGQGSHDRPRGESAEKFKALRSRPGDRSWGHTRLPGRAVAATGWRRVPVRQQSSGQRSAAQARQPP
jgi:hypothetical protein